MKKKGGIVRKAMNNPVTAVLAILVAMFALGATPTTAPAQPLSMTIAYQPIMPYLAPAVAQEMGFFKEAGLDVKTKRLFSTGVIRGGMESGEIAVGTQSVDHLIRAHIAGFDFKLVYPAVFYDPKEPDVYIVVRSDLPIKSPRDLEGKKIGISFGGIAEAGTKAWLRAAGADIRKVKFVALRFPDMVGAIATKQVDAVHVVEPFLTTLVESGAGRILGANLDVLGGRFLVAGYTAKESWLRKNPEKARRFVQALERATKFIIENPKKALPILTKVTRIKPELAAKFFPKRFIAATVVKPVELQLAIDFTAKEGFIKKSFNYKKIISSYMPMVP